MLDEQIFWEIEDYLHHRMSEAARVAFLQRLETDADLRQQLAEHQQADAAVDAYSKEDFVEDFRKRELMEKGRQLLQAAKQQQKIKQRWIVRRVGIAAAAMLTGFFLLFQFTDLFKQQPTPTTRLSPEQVYMQYFNIEPATGSGLLSSDEEDALTARINTSLANNNYTQVIDAIDSLLQDSAFDQRSKAYFLKGTTYLQLDSTAQAIESFQNITSSATTIYEEGQWYTAGALLKKGDTEAAKNLLREIANNPKHLKTAQASEILNRLQ